jgi:hypothetical protein
VKERAADIAAPPACRPQRFALAVNEFDQLLVAPCSISAA